MLKLYMQQITGQVEVEEPEKLNIGIVYSGECEKLAKEMYGEVRPTRMDECVEVPMQAHACIHAHMDVRTYTCTCTCAHGSGRLDRS
jgi:hypothetical protein